MKNIIKILTAIFGILSGIALISLELRFFSKEEMPEIFAEIIN